MTEAKVQSWPGTIIRRITRRRKPEQDEPRGKEATRVNDRLGGGSPHDLGFSNYAGSFRSDER